MENEEQIEENFEEEKEEKIEKNVKVKDKKKDEKKKRVMIKKKKKMKPLDELLKDPKYGLKDIRKRCTKIVNSKSSETQILNSLLKEYRIWLSDLLPKHSFTQGLEKLEKLSNSMRPYIEEISDEKD